MNGKAATSGTAALPHIQTFLHWQPSIIQLTSQVTSPYVIGTKATTNEAFTQQPFKGYIIPEKFIAKGPTTATTKSNIRLCMSTMPPSTATIAPATAAAQLQCGQ